VSCDIYKTTYVICRHTVLMQITTKAVRGGRRERRTRRRDIIGGDITVNVLLEKKMLVFDYYLIFYLYVVWECVGDMCSN